MNLVTIKKFQKLNKFLIESDGVFIVQHFNNFIDDVKKLRLFCVLHDFKLLKFKNAFSKTLLTPIKIILHGTFFFIFIRKNINLCDNSVLQKNLMLLLNFFETENLKLLVLLFTYKGLSLTSFQLNFFLKKLKNFKKIDLLIFLKFFYIFYIFKLKILFKKELINYYANN